MSDTLGRSNSQNGQFNVIGTATAAPEVSHLLVTEAVNGSDHNGGLDTADRVLITWHASTTTGIAGASLTIDNKTSAAVGGPNALGNCYSAFGPLTEGKHNYTVQTTDNSGRSSSLTGTFQIVAALTVAADAPPFTPAASISDADLGAIVTEAMYRLEGIYGPGVGTTLAGVSVEVTDLSGKTTRCRGRRKNLHRRQRGRLRLVRRSDTFR